MNPEHIKSQIGSALDLLQLITEDVENEFISAHVDGAVRARATLIVSSLAILDSYLHQVCEEAGAA